MRRGLLLLFPLALFLLPQEAAAEQSRVWALVINNDTEEERHAKNLGQAVEALSSRYGLRDHDLVSVGPGDRRAVGPSVGLPATGEGLGTAVAALSARGVHPDLLIVYMTGHGKDTPSGDFRYPLGHHQLTGQAIRALLHGVARPVRLIVIVDTCYSGLATRALKGLSDNATLVSSTGATVTSCKRFAHSLWHDLGDPNVSLEQAFDRAKLAHGHYLDKHPEWDPPDFTSE